MDPFEHLDHSLYHNSSTTPDVPNVYERVTTIPPLDSVPTYHITSNFRPQVGSGLPFLPPTGHYLRTNRVLTPFSADSSSDASETSFYDPSTSAHESTSPTLRAPHVHNPRRYVSRKFQSPWPVPRLR